MRLIFVLALFAGALHSQPLFTAFDAPGAGTGSGSGTFATAISPNGSIVGYTSGTSQSGGFVRLPNGTINTFMVQGSPGTRANSINNGSEIAGVYPASGGYASFVMTNQGAVTTFAVPGMSWTWAGNISDSGVVVGFAMTPPGPAQGFLRDASGAITLIHAPGAGTAAGQGTYAVGTDDVGDVAGYFIDSHTAYHGFLLSPAGVYTTFDVPGAGAGFEQGTQVAAVNRAGEITGTWFVPAGVGGHGYLRHVDGSIASFTVPGCSSISPDSLNSGGDVAGVCYSSAAAKGFLWSPKQGSAVFSAPGAGHKSGQGTYFQGIAGAITGYYFDPARAAHAFVLVGQVGRPLQPAAAF